MNKGLKTLAVATMGFAFALTASAQTGTSGGSSTGTNGTPIQKVTPPSTGTTSGGSTIQKATPPSSGSTSGGSPIQKATPPSNGSQGNLEQRRANQQKRIGQGIASGQETPWEGKRLESEEALQGKEARAMASANGGKLTQGDKQRLENQDNKMSHQIYTYKHNDKTENTQNTALGDRQKMQQERIGKGIENGKVTASEGSQLERQQSNIQHQVYNERKANGGTLTPAQRQQINQRQNNASRNIRNQKGNARKR